MLSCGDLAKTHSGTSPALAFYLLKITSALLTAEVVPHFPSLTTDSCISGWWMPAATPAHAASSIPWNEQQPPAQGQKGPAPQRQTETTKTQGEAAAGLPVVVGHYKCIYTSRLSAKTWFQCNEMQLFGRGRHCLAFRDCFMTV